MVITKEEKMKKNKVTLDDVRNAIENEGLDVFKTNANKVRSIIGTGSFSTIQKFLNHIREELQTKSEPDNKDEIILTKESCDKILGDIVAGVKSSLLVNIKDLQEKNAELVEQLSIGQSDNQAMLEELKQLERTLSQRDEDMSLKDNKISAKDEKITSLEVELKARKDDFDNLIASLEAKKKK